MKMDDRQAQIHREILDRIQIAEETQAPSLDLSFPVNNGHTFEEVHFTEIPAEIRRLTALTTLQLQGWLNLTDLKPLSGLISLQSLNMSRCEKVADLSPLSGLTSLRSLNLSRSTIDDLGPLSALTSLQSLELYRCERIGDLSPLSALTSMRSLGLSSCGNIDDLSPLSGLTSLQSLDLSSKKIADLSPLSGLTSLKSLQMIGCRTISDLSPLSGLTSLQSLTLSGCANVGDLSPLSGLTSLQSLAVSRCANIGDLSPLSGLTSLQSLDVSWCANIDDLSPLSRLTSLQSLTASGCANVGDLSPLSGLTSLQTLYVSACENIHDLSPLAGFTSLQTLGLENLRNGLPFAPLIPLLPALNKLYLFDTHWTDLPPELCGDYYRDNVLEKIRAHYRDLQSGAEPNPELKILFLGNGGAGKSQLSRRLRGLKYNPNLPTTHGIQLHTQPLKLKGFKTPVILNHWDFGGQEIYHGSHALFLQGQSVFLILWTPGKEPTPNNAGTYEENGLAMRHRPLPYWLDYVRWFAGTSAPVLLIQSQCDSAAQRIQQPPGLDEQKENAGPAAFEALQLAYVSAYTSVGLDLVRASLKEAVRWSLEKRPPPPIGAGRARVRARLRELLAADQERPAASRRHRWLERPFFNQLCDEAGGVSDTEALLDFLHHSGVVFYRRGLFDGRIVLDQNWALEAIYALFDRSKILPLLRGHGRFSRKDLELLVWREYNPDEQRVFLQMMESCGICFPTRQLPDGEPEYIAPELLPGWSEAQDVLLTGRLLQEPPDAEAEARYEFLHEAVLRGFLSEIGSYAGDDAIYWRFGCWLYEKTTDSRVVIDSEWEDAQTEAGPGRIRLRAWGKRARDMIEPLLGELRNLPVGHMPDFKTPSGPKITDLQFATPVQPDAGPPAVYISYAWGNTVVDRLCESLKADGWNVIYDRSAMRNGDLITAFMKTIAEADRIIVVIGEKYLTSSFCMTELYGIYQRSSGDKQDFLRRIVPLSLDDAKFSHWRDRVEIARHWSAEFEEMEKQVRHLSQPDLCAYKTIRDWHNRVPDLLAYIADELHPQGLEAIEKDNFHALKQMLRNQ